MFIDRCSGARGIRLQRGVRYPLAISLRLSLSHPNVSLMCAYVYVHIYICVCVCVCVAFLIFHVRALRSMKHPTRFFNRVRNYVELSVLILYAKISAISCEERSRIVPPFFLSVSASASYLHCIPKNARLARSYISYCVSRWILTCGNDGYRYVSVRPRRTDRKVLAKWKGRGRPPTNDIVRFYLNTLIFRCMSVLYPRSSARSNSRWKSIDRACAHTRAPPSPS